MSKYDWELELPSLVEYVRKGTDTWSGLFRDSGIPTSTLTDYFLREHKITSDNFSDIAYILETQSDNLRSFEGESDVPMSMNPKDHGFENPNDWVLSSLSLWGKEEKPMKSVKFIRKNPIVTDMENILVHLDVPDYRVPEIVEDREGLVTSLDIPDIQAGYVRHPHTMELTPMHDQHAIDILMQVAELVDVDFVRLGGDIGENAELTRRWAVEPKVRRTLQPSLIEINRILTALRERQQTAQFMSLKSNHDEDRVFRMLLSSAPELLEITPSDDLEGYPLISVERLYNFEKLGIELAGEGHYRDGAGEHYASPNLIYVHFTKSKPVGGAMSAYQMCRQYQANVKSYHTHRVEYGDFKFEKAGGGYDLYSGYVGGTLAKVGYKADQMVGGYKKPYPHTQAISITNYHTHDTSIPVQTEHIPIWDGKALFRGQILESRVDTGLLLEEMNDLLASIGGRVR